MVQFAAMIVKKRGTIIVASIIIGAIILVLVLTLVRTGKIDKNPLSVSHPTQVAEKPESSKQNSQNISVPTKSATPNYSTPASNLPPGVSTIVLKAVEGKQGSGTAVVITDGKNLVIAVEAQLPEVPNGQNYFGWFANDKSLKKSISLGKLQKSGEKFIISYKQTGNFSQYRTIVITQETNDDGKPEARILEGSL